MYAEIANLAGHISALIQELKDKKEEYAKLFAPIKPGDRVRYKQGWQGSTSNGIVEEVSVKEKDVFNYLVILYNQDWKKSKKTRRIWIDPQRSIFWNETIEKISDETSTNID